MAVLRAHDSAVESGLLRRYLLPIGYVTVLAVVSAVYAHVMSGSDQRSFVGWASTNVANLASRPVSALVVSAFLSVDPIIVWAVLTTVGLILLVRRFGNLRSAILVVTAHVAGTAVSEGITGWRLAIGAAPTTVRHINDVGPSYVTVSALIAVAVFGNSCWQRAVALACWLVLAPFLFEGIAAFNVAAIGHVVSMLAGVLVGAFLRQSELWSTESASPFLNRNTVRGHGSDPAVATAVVVSHEFCRTGSRGSAGDPAPPRSPKQGARSR
jgi:rhomboid family protein